MLANGRWGLIQHLKGSYDTRLTGTWNLVTNFCT
jgi:hypothetical protein